MGGERIATRVICLTKYSRKHVQWQTLSRLSWISKDRITIQIDDDEVVDAWNARYTKFPSYTLRLLGCFLMVVLWLEGARNKKQVWCSYVRT